MLFTFLMGLLLLVTIGGISRPSVQSLFHTLLTACCLLAGNVDEMTNKTVAVSCMIVVCIVGIIFYFLLKRQIAYRSLKLLFTSLFLVILAVSLMIYVLPPSLFRLEYSIVFSIILIGISYSMFSESRGGQIVGIICILDALTLLVGLNSQILVFITLIVFYGLFSVVAAWMIKKQGYVQEW